VVINNYRQNDWEPYLYYTADFGQTWKRMADGKKVSGHCLSVCQDPMEEKLVFLGTEHGLWVSFDAGNNWTKWNKQFPSVPVSDLQLQTRENDLVIATFGRALWILDDITPLREFARRGRSLFDKQLVLFPVQDAWQAGYNRPAGMRFPADAWYEGENKRYGAALNFWVKRSDRGSEKLTITGEVYDASGKKIRTHRFKVDSSGFYRIHWRLISDGIRFPAHETPGPDSDLPEGPAVAPGKYKLVLRYGIHADSSWCQVLPDPAKPFNSEAYNATMAAYRAFMPVVERATRAFDALNKAESTLDAVKESHKHAHDSILKKIELWSKPMRDSIANLKLRYMLPRDYRAYEFATVRLNNLLYDAFNYLMNSESAPGSNALDAARLAGTETDKICSRINLFFAREWTDFRAKIEALPANTFPLIDKF